MINKIISGISNKIFENYRKQNVFKDDNGDIRPVFQSSGDRPPEIYTESGVQNMTKPCFLINHIESDMDMIINPRYYFNSRFDILYFSDKFDKFRDCAEVCTLLFYILEYIPLDDGIIRGTNMHSTFSDDILHFTVDYNLIVSNNLDTVDKMQDIKITQGLEESKWD